MIEIKPSTIFSSGTEYEIFLDNFCYRCKACVLLDDGFPALVENGGCKILDAMERARFDSARYPAEEIAQIEEDGKVKYFHVCRKFETDNKRIMAAYKALISGKKGGKK